MIANPSPTIPGKANIALNAISGTVFASRVSWKMKNIQNSAAATIIVSKVLIASQRQKGRQRI
jgi:hypothetical protein